MCHKQRLSTWQGKLPYLLVTTVTHAVELLLQTTQGTDMAIMSNTLQSFNPYYAM